MKEKFADFISEKCPGAQPLLIVVRGSQAYGTNLPTSDTDYAGVYIQQKEDIYGFRYKEQINDDKNDTVFYEVHRFLELVSSNNPTILELLNTPEDCIIYKDPIFDKILENRQKFITKTCSKSFGGYAIQQIKKAKGQDKKQNWEKERVERKTPLDFCYLHLGSKSIPLTDWLKEYDKEQSKCGLSKIPHSRDVYALYYDFSENYTEEFFKDHGIKDGDIKFKGIAFEDSNDIRLSSIPFGVDKEWFVGHLSYNKDEYSKHCKDFNSYQEWLEKRNEQRWVDVQSHGQKIDGKNMMHCRRLLEMSREIAEGKGIIVRRPNREELLAIRKGEVDLQSLIDRAEKDISEIDDIFSKSSLPDSVDADLIHNLLVEIRTDFYKL